MSRKKQVRKPPYTEHERHIRDKLASNTVDEAEGAELIRQECAEIQKTWSDADRRGRSGNRTAKHVEIQETGEGQYSQNRKAAIGRPKT